jgi:DNA invertase Pin-like site-specific DNA recombinase
MNPPTAAAVYARISLDSEGLEKGVKRQVADCRKLADSLDWHVADEYIDNDTSAYSGKHRPEYERMLADMQDGSVDAVLVYNLDRLTRQPKEFERFNDIAAAVGMTNVRFVTEGMELGTDDGLFVGRIQAAMAAKESATKSRRIKRKNDERAAEGLPNGGGNWRPFGFEADRVTHNEAEAKVVRQLANRLLAGESLRSLAAWLNEKGVSTTSGGEWQSSRLRVMITSPRVAGLKDHRGEIVGPAVWKSIISSEDRLNILTVIEQRTVAGRRAPRRYLLSGMLRCSLCGNRLFSAARKSTRRYVCQSGLDHGGCGRITVVAAPVEELIADAVLYRLDTVDLAKSLAGRSDDDEHTARLLDEISADSEQLSELATTYANKGITIGEWMTARRVIEDRKTASEKRLRRATNTTQLGGLIGQGDALRTQWATLNLDRQVAIVRAVLNHVVISPGSRAATALDPGRVSPIWHL